MDNSYWISSVQNIKKDYEKLENKQECEICVIGAGLTGLTCAYYLSKLGKKVIILEKNKIMSHTSGNTTAKITSQHGLFYKYLINSYGATLAKQYLDANEQAIKNIYDIIVEEKIDCDFEWQDSYVFTQDEKEIPKIKQEVKAVNSLGLDAEFVEDIEVPIKVKNREEKPELLQKKTETIQIRKEVLGAIKFKNQAQFNPCKYGYGIANAINKYGGKIYENSKVLDLEKENGKYNVITENGKIIAQKVILATHYPIINYPGFYFMKMYQVTSYLIGVEVNGELFDGMYINSENPTISLRTAKDGDKKIVLIGGMDHKTGAKIDLKNSYKRLEEVAKQLYPDSKVLYRWNTEDCVSLDKIPYIGEFSNLMPNVYVGTGYKKWGMTNSNVAANIIVDKIMERNNPYEEVFKSTRLKPIKNYEELGNMIKEVSYSLVINKLKEGEEYTKNINKDEGKIVEIDNKKVGIYKDENGMIYAVKPICTHLGCELSWNNLDKTWDCPCHGSRFTYEGKSIYDPSIKDLERLN